MIGVKDILSAQEESLRTALDRHPLLPSLVPSRADSEAATDIHVDEENDIWPASQLQRETEG